MIRKEKGEILVLFAIGFTVLLLFTSLAIDLALALMHRDRVKEVAVMARETRMDFGGHEMWMSENPNSVYTDLATDIAVRNGMSPSQVRTEFEHTENTISRRSARANVIMEDTYETTTLRIIGIEEIPITVRVDGTMLKSGGGRVWGPGQSYIKPLP
ncbi:hypothetical protein [Tindallia magadiensis]|nr:hypothetical protein [Tindallia magadiensis]